MDRKTGQCRLMDLIKLREKMKSFSSRGKEEKIFQGVLKLADKIKYLKAKKPLHSADIPYFLSISISVTIATQSIHSIMSFLSQHFGI